MNVKKIISLITVATLVVANSVSVFAGTINVESVDTGYTANTTVTTEVTAEMLGEDVVVTVPSQIQMGIGDEVDLSSSNEYFSYAGTSWASIAGLTAGKDHLYVKGVQITEKGVMPDGKQLFVSIIPENGLGSDYLKLTHTTNSGIVITPNIMSNAGTSIESVQVTDNAGTKHRAKYYTLDKNTVSASHVCDNNFIIAFSNKQMQSIGTYTGTLNYFVAVCDDEDGFKDALVAQYNN